MLIKQLLYAYYDTQCLYAVSQLKIAEYLNSGKKSIVELAALTHTNENKLYRIMRFLSARGLFDELPNKNFALNKESDFLLASTAGNLQNFIDLHGKYFYEGAMGISKSMDSNLTAFEIAIGKPAWKLFEEQPEVGNTYNRAMQEVSEYYGKLAVEKYDFSPYKNIVDVGGGLGSLLVNILKTNLVSQGINFDLPSLQKEAEAYFEQEGLTERCKYVGGSFFDTIPAGGDLYIFKAIFHGKTDEQAIAILNNTKKILPTSGRILLIERMIIQGDSFLDGCLNDINMLNITTGSVRSFDEYKNLFIMCGLKLTKLIPLEDALQMIELKKE